MQQRLQGNNAWRNVGWLVAVCAILFLSYPVKAQIAAHSREVHCACVNLSDAQPLCNPSTKTFVSFEYEQSASIEVQAAAYNEAADAGCKGLSDQTKTCVHVPQDTYTSEEDSASTIRQWCEQAANALGITAQGSPGEVVESPFTLPGDIRQLNQLGTTSIPILIGRFVRALMGIVGSIALLVLIYGGFLWMTSIGNADRIGKAKNLLVWGALGVLVILSSYAIVSFLFEVF